MSYSRFGKHLRAGTSARPTVGINMDRACRCRAAVGRAFMPAKLCTQNKYHMLCEIEGITARAQVPALRKESRTNLTNTTITQQVPRACCDKRSHGWRSARLGAGRPVEGKAACTRCGMRRYWQSHKCVISGSERWIPKQKCRFDGAVGLKADLQFNPALALRARGTPCADIATAGIRGMRQVAC